MPIYEYLCQACGHRLETIQKVSDPVLTDCPQCEAPQLKKLVSLAAFRLKGGGWYETDFKSGGRKNVSGESDNGASSDTASDSGGSSGGDSESASSTSADTTKSAPASSGAGAAAD